MSDPERTEFGYEPRDPFIGTVKIAKADIVQDFRSPPNALLPTEEQIEEQFWHEVLIEDTDASRHAVSKAIAFTMRALAKPDEGVVERVREALVMSERGHDPGSLVLVDRDDLRAVLSSLSDNAGVR